VVSPPCLNRAWAGTAPAVRAGPGQPPLPALRPPRCCRLLPGKPRCTPIRFVYPRPGTRLFRNAW
jgi:hypothetical protein